MAFTAPASASIAACTAPTGSPVFGTVTVNEPGRPVIVNVTSYISVSVPAGSTCCVSLTATTGTPLPYNPPHALTNRPSPRERVRRLDGQLAHESRPRRVCLPLTCQRASWVGGAER